MCIRDRIVTGDHHTTFVVRDSDVTLVNPGPIYRMSADMVEHEPAVFVWDLLERDLVRVPVPAEDPDSAFVMTEIERYQQGARSAHRSFTSGLTGEEDGKGNDADADDGSLASAPTPESWSSVPFEERLRLLLADMPPEVQAEVRLAWRRDLDAYDNSKKTTRRR